MKLIFWGLILSFFNFNITTSVNLIGLLPDFIGYLLILRGCRQLMPSVWLEKLRGPAVFMIFVTGVEYFFNLLGIVIMHEIVIIFVLLGIMGTVVRIYILYCLTRAVKDISGQLDVYLGGDKLHKAWLVIAICQAVDIFCLLLSAATPDFATLASYMAMIVSLVGYVWYLVVFYNCRKFYDNEIIYREHREAQTEEK